MSIPQYSATQYGVSQYSSTSRLFFVALTETQASTESKIFGDAKACAETQSMALTIAQAVLQAARTETQSMSLALSLGAIFTRTESLLASDARTLEVFKALSQTLSSSESFTQAVGSLRTDALTISETVSQLIQKGTLSETLTLGDGPSSLPSRYGVSLYNTIQYNSRRLGGNRGVGKAAAETLTLTENLAKLIGTLLVETLTMSDEMGVAGERLFADLVFLTLLCTVGISNKALTETLQVQNWFEIRNQLGTEIWTNIL